MDLTYSFVIPVFNRPNEIRELLESMSELRFSRPFEVVIVEDGSTLPAREVVSHFSSRLWISYLQKSNSGPGSSRNYGMLRAQGNYFLILDSDVILPPDYLEKVDASLTHEFVDCFGGPDTAHDDFTTVQKAINYTMTSFLTTGGIRGGRRKVGGFQPRSFNMGLSRAAFEATGGFGTIHPGEDPDLALRLQEKGFKTVLFDRAVVYHKRRITWRSFFSQVEKFGRVRVILNRWHPTSAKITFWFPLLFCAGLIISLIMLFFGIWIPIGLYLCYLLLLFADCLRTTGDPKVAGCSMAAALIQFFGYGFGFWRATYYLRILNQDPRRTFPQLFYDSSTKN